MTNSLDNVHGMIDARLKEARAKRAALEDDAVEGRSSAVNTLTQYPISDLTRALITLHNPQDVSGPALPSGNSVDSRATGSTHPSGYSSASGQYPPPSQASSSMGRTPTAGSDRKGKGRANPYPPSSLSSESTVAPQPTRAGFQPTQQAGTSAHAPDREQGVKTPRGRHLRPEIKQKIAELGGKGYAPVEIAALIPELKASQASSLLQRIRDPDSRKRSMKKRAEDITGRADATAADYEYLQKVERARQMMGRPDATPAEYYRALRATQAARELGRMALLKIF
ncbi:MAG: hypothetical protein QOI13_383 [Paraburkholderia sp.]|nr:hypothetical protein [Paraburkholderia sp.]